MAFSDSRMPVRRVLTLSLLVAMELALAALESLFPPMIQIPGIKIGLANIITLTAFSLIRKREVFLVIVMRLILTGLVLGSFLTPVFWISGAGCLLSYVAMAISYGRGSVSIVGVSLLGAAAHNTGQLTAVSLMLGNQGAFYYLPWLLLWAVPMGLFTGVAARSAISILDKSGLGKR